MRGVNAILDAVITPLNVAANYVDRISKGDIPAQITDTYNGDFNTIKNNLNTLIAAMNEITAAAEEISNGRDGRSACGDRSLSTWSVALPTRASAKAPTTYSAS